MSRGLCPGRLGAIVAAALVAMLGACATLDTSEVPKPPARPSEFRVAPGLVPPLGSCRIVYGELPADRQPPSMSCGRAHEVAARHGGRVVKAISKKSFQDGSVLASDYGPGGFAGIPADRLPPPGLCRAWYDRAPPERQPPPMPCEKAERLVRDNGGRLLYMPGSDLR